MEILCIIGRFKTFLYILFSIYVKEGRKFAYQFWRTYNNISRDYLN